MSKTKDPVRAEGGEYVIVAGRFSGGGSSATTKISGVGWTIGTGAGSGVYTIVFKETYKTLIAFHAQINANTPADVDTMQVVGDVDGFSAGSLPILISDAGTPGDITATQFCDFVAVFQDTGVTP